MKEMNFKGPLGKRYANLPACKSVGELVDLLQQLPRGMPLALYDGVKPVVFNEKTNIHLSIEDNDGTWD